MNQSQFLAITCNSLEAREKSRVHGAIGFGFASHWLKNWRESSKPITERSNRNHVITFDSHLKTALFRVFLVCFSDKTNHFRLSIQQDKENKKHLASYQLGGILGELVLESWFSLPTKWNLLE